MDDAINDASGSPTKSGFALRTEHLITSINLGNPPGAFWTGFAIIFNEGDGFACIFVADVITIFFQSFDFVAFLTNEIEANRTFPSG